MDKYVNVTPFLMLDDIDDVWEELLDGMPDLNDVAANLNLQKFCDYMNNTWIKDKCLFPRSSWNLFDEYSSRTNNISESCNHQINGQVDSANSNVYKVLALTKKQEALTSTSYERVNLGKAKKTANKQKTKDAQIALIKCKYENGSVEVMDYLMQISAFCKNYDEKNRLNN